MSAAAIVVAAGLAYANSLHGALLLDDHPTIEANPSIRSLASWHVLHPPAQVGTAGRPLANVTFAINHALGGDNPVGYHVVNFAIHVATALLLAGIVRRTLRLPRFARGSGRAGRWLPTAIGLAWAVHPLATQAVTYLSQRTEVMAACGMTTVVYCLLRYTDGRRPGWLVAGWMAQLAAVASKETAAVGPLAVFAFDAAFVAGSARAAWAARKTWYLSLAGSWVVLAVLMANADLAARGVGFDQAMSPITYAAVECRALAVYAGLAVWPHPLIFDYGWAPPVSWVACFAVVVALGASAYAVWRGWVAGWLAVLWFLLLAPTSSVIPIAEQPLAESRAYLANAMVVAAIALGVWRLLGRRAIVPFATAAVALIAMTAARNAQYRSEAGLWRDTAAKRPGNARAWSALGFLEYEAGDAAKAIALHEKAAALRPTYAEAQGNLGADLLLARRPEDAVTHFRRALAIEPQLPDGRSNLAQALLAAGNRRLFAHDVRGAISAYEEALRLDPKFASAENNLAAALLQAGRFDESLEHANAALRLQPDYAAAHGTAATAALQLGRLDEAVVHFRAALALEPTAPSHTGLGFALARQGGTAAAMAEFQAALGIDPNYAPARRALAEIGK